MDEDDPRVDELEELARSLQELISQPDRRLATHVKQDADALSTRALELCVNAEYLAEADFLKCAGALTLGIEATLKDLPAQEQAEAQRLKRLKYRQVEGSGGGSYVLEDSHPSASAAAAGGGGVTPATVAAAADGGSGDGGGGGGGGCCGGVCLEGVDGNGVEGGLLRATVPVPTEVACVSDLELDLSARRLLVSLRPGAGPFAGADLGRPAVGCALALCDVELPVAVDVGSAQAKFSPKRHVLVVTMRRVW